MARLTGLSPHVLRAWERRYGAVRPLRTAGGTRRYTEADVARLRLLRETVEAGHSIGDVAGLPTPELERRAAAREAVPQPPLHPLLEAVEHMDAPGAERLLALQLSALGPRRFINLVAVPLLQEIGRRWETGRLGIASEHLASALVRNLLGSVLRTHRTSADAPTVLFTTLPGERHELGVLACAVIAAEVGAHAVFLGPDLPLDEVTRAARSLDARAVAVGLARLPRREGERLVQKLRAALPTAVELWVGGHGSGELVLPETVQRVASLEELERKVALLGVRSAWRAQ